MPKCIANFGAGLLIVFEGTSGVKDAFMSCVLPEIVQIGLLCLKLWETKHTNQAIKP